jgi:hypothetical protein
MDLDKKEYGYYLFAIVATAIFEIANIYGAGVCILPLVVLGVAYFAFKVFPKKDQVD